MRRLPFPNFFTTLQIANRQCAQTNPEEQGFALPVALGMGFVMVTLGIATLVISQSDLTNSWQRKESGASLAVAEGGLARTLAKLTAPNNAVLLPLNYDTINPKTGKTYLGPDGVPNSGDEEDSVVDQWSGATTNPCLGSSIGPPNMSTNGTMGQEGQYSLKAYRFNSTQQTAHLLVEGIQRGSSSYIAITLNLTSDNSFPGVLTSQSTYLQGRRITGKNANLYYNPDYSSNSSLLGFALPKSANRSEYLDAIWSGTTDGFNGDAVSGKITGCPITFTMPNTAQGNDLGILNSSRTITGTSGTISHYQTPKIQLTGNDAVTVDTTAGPVYLYVNDESSLRGNSQIRNMRTDGQTPQVGDLRIIVAANNNAPLELFDTSCIDTAFLYSPYLDLQIKTTGDGCPSPGHSNFDGVVWVEDIVNAKGSATTRSGTDTDGTLGTTLGVTSGISVPDDVTSLADILTTTTLPIKYQFGQVKHWQRMRL